MAPTGRMTKATPNAAKVLNMASTGSPDGKYARLMATAKKP